MSAHNDGGPAFPANFTFKSIDHIPCGEIGEAVDVTRHSPGMTLRDYFAAKAMAGWFGNSDSTMTMRVDMPFDEFQRQMCEIFYAWADAMLAARGAA